jgi:hypothetical protein
MARRERCDQRKEEEEEEGCTSQRSLRGPPRVHRRDSDGVLT